MTLPLSPITERQDPAAIASGPHRDITAAEIAHFQAHGYVALRGVLSGDQVAGLRD